MLRIAEWGARRPAQVLLDAVDAASVPAQVIASNTPARVLQEASERPDAGLLVMGSTTRGRLRRVLLGTVGGRLVEGGGCPLAIASHGYGDTPSHDLRVVGAAYDGSDEARRALDAAQTLAARAGARLRIITVHQPVAFGAVPTSMLTPDVSVNRKLEEDARRVNDEAVAARQGELVLDVPGRALICLTIERASVRQPWISHADWLDGKAYGQQ